MIKKKGMPITGTNTAMKPKQPVLSDAAHTSADAQKQITRPPMPFANSNSVAQQPPAARASGGISTLQPKIASGLQRTTPGAKALPAGSPVGQKTQPNQYGQIGGRMGFPPPKRRSGNNGSGYPAKKNARFYGE